MENAANALKKEEKKVVIKDINQYNKCKMYDKVRNRGEEEKAAGDGEGGIKKVV